MASGEGYTKLCDPSKSLCLPLVTSPSAGASLVGIVDADVDWVVKVAAELLGLLLGKGVSGNNYAEG